MMTRPMLQPESSGGSSIRRIAKSFYFAFVGLFFLLRTQRNARIEVLIGGLACILAAWLGISRIEWAIIIFTIALVLILEGLNTAIEAAIDLASPEIHPLAKAAKDLAAGMVLIAAIASILVGLLILGPPLWHATVPPQSSANRDPTPGDTVRGWRWRLPGAGD